MIINKYNEYYGLLDCKKIVEKPTRTNNRTKEAPILWNYPDRKRSKSTKITLKKSGNKKKNNIHGQYTQKIRNADIVKTNRYLTSAGLKVETEGLIIAVAFHIALIPLGKV